MWNYLRCKIIFERTWYRDQREQVDFIEIFLKIWSDEYNRIWLDRGIVITRDSSLNMIENIRYLNNLRKSSPLERELIIARKQLLRKLSFTLHEKNNKHIKLNTVQAELCGVGLEVNGSLIW